MTDAPPELQSNVSDWHWIKIGTNPVYCAVAQGQVLAMSTNVGQRRFLLCRVVNEEQIHT